MTGTKSGPTASRAAALALILLALTQFVVTGCAHGPPKDRTAGSAQSLEEIAERSQSDPAGLRIEETDPLDPAVEELLEDLALTEAERRASSRAEVATRLISDSI